jgi:hypothetical protein
VRGIDVATVLRFYCNSVLLRWFFWIVQYKPFCSTHENSHDLLNLGNSRHNQTQMDTKPERITLSQQDFESFVAAIADPPELNAAMAKAIGTVKDVLRLPSSDEVLAELVQERMRTNLRTALTLDEL